MNAPTASQIASAAFPAASASRLAPTTIAAATTSTQRALTSPVTSGRRLVRFIAPSLWRSTYWLSADAPAADSPPVTSSSTRSPADTVPAPLIIAPPTAASSSKMTIRSLNNTTSEASQPARERVRRPGTTSTGATVVMTFSIICMEIHQRL